MPGYDCDVLIIAGLQQAMVPAAGFEPAAP